MQGEKISVKTLEMLQKLIEDYDTFLATHAYVAVRSGNRRLAYEIIKNLSKNPGYGFNNLHHDVLKDKGDLE